ncbi:homogentisate 1,2-dioxygenase [Sphingobium aquiterrae]|uniref:homogentisate 1,2-dioxygenase n=1 Tax=Sphingobium aquiterrae TaxID=2038656 RepID=UPI003019CEC3
MLRGMILAGCAAGCAMLAPALAQVAAESCPPSSAAPLPAELAAWTSRSPAVAAADSKALAGAMLSPGRAVDARLSPTGSVTYAVRPEKPGGSVSHGGLFAFTVAQAGTYRVALGSGAWIDLLKGRTVIASRAHGHGPACSGIRKMVDFPLKPGRYILQIAGNGDAVLPLMVTRLP